MKEDGKPEMQHVNVEEKIKKEKERLKNETEQLAFWKGKSPCSVESSFGKF